ncbi:MAG: chromosome partitioning protein ParB [Bacteroidia bacterium]|nr:MAG: chromosome partitioning protein ParB [Bacteroidia bacterium]
MAKKAPLGKGLGAIIDSSRYEEKPIAEAVSTGAVCEIPIQSIETNPFQPREEFNEEALDELKNSILKHGIIQPITVRKTSEDKFQLISGERRLRASKEAGLKKIIAFVRETDDQGMLEMALIENIQRENLNAIEIAISYQRLLDECKLTQDELAERVGKKRSTVTNYIRLLKLPPEIQAGLQQKRISMGHARALINIENAEQQIQVYEKIIAQGLSVRDTEQIIRTINYPLKKKLPKTTTETATRLPDPVAKFRDELSEIFMKKVTIKRSNSGKGSVNIPFTSDADLEKIKEILLDIKS